MIFLFNKNVYSNGIPNQTYVIIVAGVPKNVSVRCELFYFSLYLHWITPNRAFLWDISEKCVWRAENWTSPVKTRAYKYYFFKQLTVFLINSGDIFLIIKYVFGS